MDVQNSRAEGRTSAKNVLVVFAGIGLCAFLAYILINLAGNWSSKGQVQSGRITDTTSCTNGGPMHADLDKSASLQLRKLAEYEVVCDGSVVDSLMLFVQMPLNVDDGTKSAITVADTLKEFAKFNVRPLVVFEPSMDDDAVMQHIAQGRYDHALGNYYKTLGDHGISDETMGTWVFFPEENTPIWHNTDPQIYTKNITKLAQIQKRYFPNSKTSTLLNSQTYPSDDADWNDGAYKSLVPYVQDIPEGLVDMFGYQGMPWLPPANDPSSEPITDASTYLHTGIAKEAAHELGTQYIWFNTGTFGRAHTERPDTIIWMNAGQRREILEAVLTQADALLIEGFDLSINLFAEDKTHVNEGIDWSYWPAGKADGSEATVVFKGFVGAVRELGAGFSLYDAARP